MSMRAAAAALIALALLVAIVLIAPEAAARGWRTAFLTISAPVIGAVLMTAIGRVVGASWPGFAPLAAAAPPAAVAAIGIGVVQLAATPPPHLALWQHPIAVGGRAVIAAGAIAWLGMRLARGAGRSGAAIGLALYAALVTYIATDWLLGGVPGHAVSAAGMMLFVEEIGGACAAILALGGADLRFRQDMAKLMVACALALGYLTFMDYLILWYGNLPDRIGFYVVRGTAAMSALAALALVTGLAVPIGLLALRRGDAGRRLAGLSALAGLLLFNLWWTAGGPMAFVAALAAIVLLALGGAWLTRRETAHG